VSAFSFDSPLDIAREAHADPQKGKIDRKKKIYGVVTGQVIPHPPDPQALGRVLVRVPCIDSLDFVAWARIAVPMAGPLHGTYFVPNPGDDVLLAFEHGDVKVPYIIGSLWNHINRPPLPVSQAQIRTIRTLVGNQIVFTEIPAPTITIQNGPTSPVPIPMPESPVGPYQTIQLTPAGAAVVGTTVRLQSGPNNILVTADGITIQAGASFIRVGAEGITMALGSNLVSVTAAGILINGKPVSINPGG
jgi:Type VI secretion system/phage-baseplate injector OB domain